MGNYISKNGNKLYPVEEAYFGKTKNLQEAEQAFREIFIEAFGKPIVPSEYDIVAMTKAAVKLGELTRPSSPYMKRVREAFKKEFGFGVFSLAFNNFVYEPKGDPWNRYKGDIMAKLNLENFQLIMPNAHTVGNSVIKRLVTGGENLRVAPIKNGSGERYYDSKHLYACHVLIFSAIMLTRGFTPGMLMAIILHEIGHNFTCTPIVNMNECFCIFKFTSEILRLVNEPDKQIEAIKALLKHISSHYLGTLSEAIYDNLISEIYGWLMKAGPLAKLVVGMQMVFKTFDFFILPIGNLGALTAVVNYVRTFNPVYIIQNMMLSLPEYSDEVFADSFATAYGYGPEHIESEKLFDHGSDSYGKWVCSKENPFAIVWKIAACNIAVMYMIYPPNGDPHPFAQSRMAEQIDKLEDELKDANLPPELRKACEKDLKECKAAYAAYLKADDDGKTIAILSMRRVFFDKAMGGRDLRSWINQLVNLGHHRA